MWARFNGSDMKRFFGLILSMIATSILLLPIVIVAALVKLSSKGPALYWSDRVGKHNTIFKMPKFRSIKVDDVFRQIDWQG